MKLRRLGGLFVDDILRNRKPETREKPSCALLCTAFPEKLTFQQRHRCCASRGSQSAPRAVPGCPGLRIVAWTGRIYDRPDPPHYGGSSAALAFYVVIIHGAFLS
jgi:hypothetical protein